MTRPKKARPHVDSYSPTPTTTPTTTPLPSDLLKRGGYSMLRLLSVIDRAGKDGITTRRLLDIVGSHATLHQKLLDTAQEHGLITRAKGEPPGPGQFPPIYNILTEKGRKLISESLGRDRDREFVGGEREGERERELSKKK